jgi:hypothetical protein
VLEKRRRKKVLQENQFQENIVEFIVVKRRERKVMIVKEGH